MNEHVILLHGLARSPRSMNKLAQTLSQAGYQVHNCHYASTRLSVEDAAQHTISTALKLTEDAEKVHFVTHSLGGILLRFYLQQQHIINLGRVVMLAPPNQGSEVADWLQPYRLFRALFGPVSNQLGTRSFLLNTQLGPANFELGVIAGTRAINLPFYFLLPKPNDGTVSVANTKLAGMNDHICLPTTHPLIMKNPLVINQVVTFLNQGKFQH